MAKQSALTIKSNIGINKVLVTKIDVFISNTTKGCDINAIWDTGATSTAITKKVVDTLGLSPTGLAKVNTANGLATQATYTIDVKLLNNVVIQGVTATGVDKLSGGCDALIGMDIITLGDFSITNHQGTTCMSFRVPSLHEIDYVKNPTYGTTPIKTGGRGDRFTPPKKKRKR